MTTYDCDTCEWYDRDEICDECRKRKASHRHTVADEDEEDTIIFTRISYGEEEE